MPKKFPYICEYCVLGGKFHYDCETLTSIHMDKNFLIHKVTLLKIHVAWIKTDQLGHCTCHAVLSWVSVLFPFIDTSVSKLYGYFKLCCSL